MVSCTSKENSNQSDNEEGNGKEHVSTAIQLNKDRKWKADQATKRNVAEMMQVINDSSYAVAMKRRQLFDNLQAKIDTLVKQCSMQGKEHDALHIWLEKVLKDMKGLKESDDEFTEVYAALKVDIESFYTSFE